jgi:hypothetical protein
MAKDLNYSRNGRNGSLTQARRASSQEALPSTPYSPRPKDVAQVQYLLKSLGRPPADLTGLSRVAVEVLAGRLLHERNEAARRAGKVIPDDSFAFAKPGVSPGKKSTESQLRYIRVLCERLGEPPPIGALDMTVPEASDLIQSLKKRADLLSK